MAAPQDLPLGQIAPAARPVDAFLRPVDIQIAAPGRPADMPNLPQVTTIGTGQGANVQGYNSFEQLAEALAPFRKQAVEAATNGGLMYAAWRMDVGQAQAQEAVRRAQAANDQSTEAGQLEYAAANRALAVKDPQAGWLMHMLDPYTQMGWERGKSKAAGQEIEAGMAAYVAKNSGRIDYTSADQGFGALQAIRAEYINQVTTKYGVTDSSHGFQKYAAPSIEKASDRVAQAISEDRTKYFDEQKPRELAELIRTRIYAISKTGTVEYKGRTFTQADGDLFYQAAGQQLNDEAQGFLRQAGLPGQASKWAREAYQTLQAAADFQDDAAMGSWLTKLDSTEPLRDAKGKPVIGADGRPVFLNWVDRYRQERIDSQIKYEQAGFASRAARSRDIGANGEAVVTAATEGMMPGPERFQAGAAALDQFFQQEEQRLGRPLTLRERLEVKKGWKDANELNSDLLFEKDDPRVEVNYFGQLAQRQGSNFDAASERQRVRALAATIREPERAQQFLNRAMAEIEGKEKEVQDFSRYAPVRDKVISENIKARIERNYDARFDTTKPDRVESERRQRLAYTAQVNTAIKNEEARLNRKLEESEVRAITQREITGYGSKDKDALEYLFPGSMAYPKSKSVDPYGTMKPTQAGPDGKAKPEAAKPIPKVFDTTNLDDIPNRRQVLAEYDTKPVLSLNAIRQAMFAAIDGKPLSPKMERAWRDAGAPNAFTFLQRQLEFYPNYKDDEWTPAELKKARQRLSSSAALESRDVAYASAVPTMPRVAQLITWAGTTAMDVATGATSASAATRGGGGDRPFTRSAGDAVTRFRRAIITQESGGNYSAVNPDSGAMGIGQVMPANVGPWTQKYLGRRLTPQQFLKDRAAQDAVINGRFNDMLSRELKAGHSQEVAVRRAAAEWYSGQPGLWNSTRSEGKYPSIAEYTKSIWRKFQGG